MDILSLVPLDLLYFKLGMQAVYLRAPRLLKIQSFWEFFRLLDRVIASPYLVSSFSHIEMNISPFLFGTIFISNDDANICIFYLTIPLCADKVRVGRTLTYMLYMIHITACTYYAYSDYKSN